VTASIANTSPRSTSTIVDRSGYRRRVPSYDLRPIGRVESPLVDRDAAPKQGDEGSPDAWVVFTEDVRPALRDLAAGTDVILLTWLDRARRDVLVVHPRGDTSRPEQGVFTTRSPDRPNPIGLHRVTVLAVDGLRIQVRDLEALDGTPIVDVKPVLGRPEDR
jgi:tRNA-Thr(GGU) m(6)t(6)A37 methyltransferase TsaA